MYRELTLTFSQQLWRLLPELVLLLAGGLILALDAIHLHEKKTRWLPYVTLAGLAGALIATITLWGTNTRVFYVLIIDSFALLIKILALISMGIVVLVSDVYIRTHSQHQGEYYALLLFYALAMCLLSSATNLIMVFLAFDFLGITAYILTGHIHDDPHSAEAAIKYLLYDVTLSAVLLYGMSWLYGLSGATDLSTIKATLRETGLTMHPFVLPAMVFITAGFTFKIGAVPFHQWIPDVYEGTATPITALFSVGPKIAGFAILMRVLLTALSPDLGIPAINWQVLLMVIATFTMTVGNLLAMWQQNIKRLLAYSSIAQAGYILIGIAVATPQGVTAVLIHLIAYMLTNLGAFAAVIAFSNQTGSDTIDDYAGLNERAPILSLALIICLLSLGGIPPTAGFIGKLYLFSAAIEKDLYWLAIVGVINSVISLSYYWKIIRAMYIVPTKTDERLGISSALSVALGLSVLGVFIVGLFPDIFLELIRIATRTFFQ